jgi:hypothetical protein
MGAFLTKVRLFFHKVSSFINTLSPSLRAVLYAGHVKLSAECRSYSRAPCFKSLECTPQGAQKDGSRMVLNRDCSEDEGEQSTPLIQLPPLCTDWCAVWRCPAGEGMIIFLLGRTILTRFNLCSVCAYRFELTVVPLSKNSGNDIPSLSQKALAKTLPAEFCTYTL